MENSKPSNHLRILSNDYENYQAKDVPISTVLDYLSGNSGLTEEEIYQKIGYSGQRYVVLSGSTDEGTRLGKIPICNINGKQLKIFENRDGILISRNGLYAGTAIFTEKGKYALNDHAYMLHLKENCQYQVLLKWLMYQSKHTFFDYCTSSDNLTWNMTLFFKQVKIDIPSFKEQIKVVTQYDKLFGLKEHIQTILSKIQKIKESILVENYENYQAKDVPISTVLDYLSGNLGLTEEEIYQTIGYSGQRYVVLSGSTDEGTRLGKIPICNINGRTIRVFENKEGILIIRVGDAGSTTFLKKGKYTITENAYILFLKDGCKYQVSLKWLMYQCRSSFLQYSPSANYGAWNMTGFFKNVLIDIPSFKKQENIIKEYEHLEKLNEKLVLIKKKISELL